MREIGVVQEIIRHPVKSMRGENISEAIVGDYGIYGDRSHALLDLTRSGKYLTASEFPGMIGYKAVFKGENQVNGYPKLEILSPLGHTFDWKDEALTQEIREATNRQVSKVEFGPESESANWDGHVLITTDASLRRMEELWKTGRKGLDPRRFRGNIHISLDEDTPFLEDEWIGKQLIIKNTIFKLDQHCERCMMITIDPESIEMDPSLLKTVVAERKNRFGLYASVVQKGEIEVNHPVYIID